MVRAGGPSSFPIVSNRLGRLLLQSGRIAGTAKEARK